MSTDQSIPTPKKFVVVSGGARISGMVHESQENAQAEIAARAGQLPESIESKPDFKVVELIMG